MGKAQRRGQIAREERMKDDNINRDYLCPICNNVYMKCEHHSRDIEHYELGQREARKEFLRWLQDYLYGNALDFGFCQKKEQELKLILGEE